MVRKSCMRRLQLSSSICILDMKIIKIKINVHLPFTQETRSNLAIDNLCYILQEQKLGFMVYLYFEL